MCIRDRPQTITNRACKTKFILPKTFAKLNVSSDYFCLEDVYKRQTFDNPIIKNNIINFMFIL